MAVKNKSSREFTEVEKQTSEDDDTLLGCLVGNKKCCKYLKFEVCPKSTKNKSASCNKSVHGEVENRVSKTTMSSQPEESDDKRKVINITHERKQSKQPTKLKKSKRKCCFGSSDKSNARLNNKRLFRKGDELSKNSCLGCLFYFSLESPGFNCNRSLKYERDTKKSIENTEKVTTENVNTETFNLNTGKKPSPPPSDDGNSPRSNPGNPHAVVVEQENKKDKSPTNNLSKEDNTAKVLNIPSDNDVTKPNPKSPGPKSLKTHDEPAKDLSAGDSFSGTGKELKNAVNKDIGYRLGVKIDREQFLNKNLSTKQDTDVTEYTDIKISVNKNDSNNSSSTPVCDSNESTEQNREEEGKNVPFSESAKREIKPMLMVNKRISSDAIRRSSGYAPINTQVNKSNYKDLILERKQKKDDSKENTERNISIVKHEETSGNNNFTKKMFQLKTNDKNLIINSEYSTIADVCSFVSGDSITNKTDQDRDTTYCTKKFSEIDQRIQNILSEINTLKCQTKIENECNDRYTQTASVKSKASVKVEKTKKQKENSCKDSSDMDTAKSICVESENSVLCITPRVNNKADVCFEISRKIKDRCLEQFENVQRNDANTHNRPKGREGRRKRYAKKSPSDLTVITETSYSDGDRSEEICLQWKDVSARLKETVPHDQAKRPDRNFLYVQAGHFRQVSGYKNPLEMKQTPDDRDSSVGETDSKSTSHVTRSPNRRYEEYVGNELVLEEEMDNNWSQWLRNSIISGIFNPLSWIYGGSAKQKDMTGNYDSY